jgi:hypothetical protein
MAQSGQSSLPSAINERQRNVDWMKSGFTRTSKMHPGTHQDVDTAQQFDTVDDNAS